MDIQSIMAMIDDEAIENIGELYKIDKVNTKITGRFILKVFVQCVLQGRPISLRSIETLVNKDKTLSSLLKVKDESKRTIDHSSLGKRLKTANVKFFKDVYESMVMKFHEQSPSQKSFHIFDSTILSTSSKLMRQGLNLGGSENDTHIKMSVSLKNSIPSSVRFCRQQSESSEDIALAAAINQMKIQKDDILLFDRGISKGETFKQFSMEKKFFVTRLKLGRRYKSLSANEIQGCEQGELKILSDENIHVYNKHGEEINCKLRLIKAQKTQGEEFWFLSNIFDLPSCDIADAYKHRWEIEVLFKFLKQHLQFKHFLGYEQNIMEIYLYCLLIAAILFAAYKKYNNLKGYKLAMLQFAIDLNKAIIKDIVLFCGGNPDLVDQCL